MNDEQWRKLVEVLEGGVSCPLPCGFIVDSPWLPGWYGVEIVEYLFNPGIQTPLADLRSLSANRLTILGSIPPRDVLARGSPEEVRCAIRDLLEHTPDRSRLILSCAGGMPPGVTTGNIRAFIGEADAVTGSSRFGG